MDKLVIEGGPRLSGEVTVSGAKNASLPILAATLLTDERMEIRNVPDVADVRTMLKILQALGVEAVKDGDRVTTRPTPKRQWLAPYKLVSTMRASICVLGPLLGRLRKAQVSMPGGCIIGPRPIDLHIKGIEALGARVKIEHGYVHATAGSLRGSTVYLGGPCGSSVLATANTMMAATLAQGRTVIENAACEPEVVDLADCLVAMGAKIHGQRTHVIEIEGVKALHGARYTIIPDRVEAGTYLLAAAMTRGHLFIKNGRAEHLGAVIDKLREAGVQVTSANGGLKVDAPRGALRPVNVTTLPYPGFPTDLQAQMMALMTITDGLSVITEKIYPERFMHISELNRMGAYVFLEGASGIVRGVRALSGAPVMASDLRASAALVLAGLVAEQRTDIARVYHLDRGYDGMERKLEQLGARIWREKA
ncbi:MAG: UDP-N-acetylglucosamine 1-carboxyvinyltransferase [Candidatus Omnitrophica bacterium]|nr:UDP-N-acetylglucosamine 1-carboxyvinyltransferase [Candidatus Omnitrophota bacterium]